MDPSNTISIESSPTTRDAWTPTGSLQLGAGPVPFTSLVLHGTTGWAVENDRTVVDGARLVSGHWQSWTPPCSTAGGQAVLGAATASAIVAVCQQGNWGPPIPPAVRAYFSNDGGATFHSTGPALGGDSSLSGAVVASPAAGVVITDRLASTRYDLIESVNSGASWQTVATAPSSMSFTYLGFTTQSQGVAIAEGEGASALMLMTYDGGRHWSPVSF
jgi:hypothetical protein